MENTESRAMPEKYLTNSFADDGLIELTDDFVLPEHLDDAKKIIRCEGTLRPGGRYISGQEVEYEGEMVYSVLYITDGNSLKNVVFKAKYWESFFAKETCYPVSDLYSCDFESTIERGALGTEKYTGCAQGAADFSETVDAPHVSELLAPRAQVQLHGARFDATEQRMYADADVLVTAVTKSDDGRLSAFDCNIPVRIKFKDGFSQPSRSNTEANLHEFEIKLAGDTIQLTGEIQAQVFCFENEDQQIVKTVNVQHDRPREDINKLPITFYYPDDGEQLWNIAKKYGTTEEIIRSANDITDDKNIGKKVLLIPVKRKKPLFSKVISK